jgi:hypothetical protein
MAHAALPAELIPEEPNLGTPALRTYDAVRPQARNKVVQTVLRIGEVNDCFLKAFGFVGGFHTSSLPENRVLRKYIIALIRQAL